LTLGAKVKSEPDAQSWVTSLAGVINVQM